MNSEQIEVEKTQPNRPRNDKLLTFEELARIRTRHPSKRIVLCHGVFDVLHAGHLTYFESAKKRGEILVITITADKYVNKGPLRPYFTESVRANMVSALSCVDYVAISHYPTAVPCIEKLKPHFYVKGPDYRDKTKDVTGAIYTEESAVKRHGGEVAFTDDETFSSSTLLNRYFMPWTKEQQKTIDQIRQLGGEETIARILEEMAHKKVCIVGEPIVDSYVFCIPESISSKSPSVSARFAYEEQYAGGALAIANHLADFVKEVRLFFTHGPEPYFRDLLNTRLDPRVKLHAFQLDNVPTPKKTRHITVDTAQRIFEITDIRADQWSLHDPTDFCRFVSDSVAAADATILADFGHGLFEGIVLESMSKLPGFVALNVQTNSSNYGFNPFTKHKRFSFLSLDTREVRLAFHDRFTAPLELGRRAFQEVERIGASVVMTLGPNGSCYFSRRTGEPHFSPAFTNGVVDPTGAGDAFFALASLLVQSHCPDPLVPFLGNIFAGLKTKIIGNKSSVSKTQFVKAYTSIMK